MKVHSLSREITNKLLEIQEAMNDSQSDYINPIINVKLVNNYILLPINNFVQIKTGIIKKLFIYRLKIKVI